MRLTREQAEGGGDGDGSGDPALDSLKEAATHGSNPLGLLIGIPARAPRSQEILDLLVGEEAQETYDIGGQTTIGRDDDGEETTTGPKGTLFDGLMLGDLGAFGGTFHLSTPVIHSTPLGGVGDGSSDGGSDGHVKAQEAEGTSTGAPLSTRLVC